MDGEKIEMKREGRDGFFFKNFALNHPIKGQNAMFRIWNVIRTEDEIKANMSKTVRTGADLVLPSGCVGEYIYTEGQGKASEYGDDGVFTAIVSERENVWQPIKNTIANIEVE